LEMIKLNPLMVFARLTVTEVGRRDSKEMLSQREMEIAYKVKYFFALSG
jgi:hypothetical protein